MTNLAEIFSAPFNWCDRRCERCPFSRDCPVWRAESQRRWVNAAHGGDPDDWDVVPEDVAEDMRAALGQLLDIAAAEGIDLDTPLPPARIVLDAVKLRRAGTALATSIAELGRERGSGGQARRARSHSHGLGPQGNSHCFLLERLAPERCVGRGRGAERASRRATDTPGA